jgi:hypothetical protein
MTNDPIAKNKQRSMFILAARSMRTDAPAMDGFLL